MRYLILKITDQCNLDCIYCYNNSKNLRTDIDMDFNTAQNAIDYSLSRVHQALIGLKIQFTGGEPLLNFKLIKEIIGYYGKTHNGIHIKYAIQTNGTLLNENIIQNIKELGIGIGISIDGIVDNDTLRPYSNKETTSTIDTMRGMYLLSNASIPFGVTIVVTKTNLPHIQESIKYFHEIFGVKSVSLDVLKPKRREDFKLLPNMDIFNNILEEIKDYPVSIKNIRRRKVTNDCGEYCFLNSGDLLFVTEIGDIYPCPTLEGSLYMGNINNLNRNFVPFKVSSKICFARKILFS